MKQIWPSWDVRFAYDKAYNKAVMVTNPNGIERNTMKATIDGIYTPNLGNVTSTDQDTLNKYSCFCGNITGKLHLDELCPNCNTVCKDQFGMDLLRIGWIDLEPFKVVLPSAYEMMNSFFGAKTLEKIVGYTLNVSLEGEVRLGVAKENNAKQYAKRIPYQNIGMQEFIKDFEKIVRHYEGVKRSPQRTEKAEFLLANIDRIFVSKIPVYSTLLRPAYASAQKKMFSYDRVNALYSTILHNLKLLRDESGKYLKLGGPALVLYAIQEALQELYDMTMTRKLIGKKRHIRYMILGSRCNWSARAVVTSLTGKNAGLDHIVFPYRVFLKMFMFQIMNIAMRGTVTKKFANMTVYELKQHIDQAMLSDQRDEDLWLIMKDLIKNHKDGLWVMANRNPSMDLGSIVMLKVVDILPDPRQVVIQISLEILENLTADFDGDVLAFFLVPTKTESMIFRHALNPRMLIVDRSGDGLLDKYGLIKDQVTNMVSFLEPYQD